MSEIETFLRIVRVFSMRLIPMASNVWIVLQPESALSKKGKFDECSVTLPKLIYGGQYPNDALALRIEHFWHGRGKKEEMVPLLPDVSLSVQNAFICTSQTAATIYA